MDDPLARAGLIEIKQYLSSIRFLILDKDPEDSDLQDILQAIADSSQKPLQRLRDICRRHETFAGHTVADMERESQYLTRYANFLQGWLGAPGYTNSRQNAVRYLRESSDDVQKEYTRMMHKSDPPPNRPTREGRPRTADPRASAPPSGRAPEQHVKANDKDPFATVRGDEMYEGWCPFDSFETPSARLEAEQEIIRLDKAFTRVDMKQKERNVFHEDWQARLVEGLIFEPAIWRLTLDLTYAEDYDSMPEVDLNPDWAIGQFLPGFYNWHENFQTGFDAIFASRSHSIIQHAVDYVKTVIDEVEGQLGKHRNIATAGFDVGPTSALYMTLCKLVNEQKRENILRKQLKDKLSSLGSLLDQMPRSKTLLETTYSTTGGVAQQSHDEFLEEENLLDDFGREVTEEYRSYIASAGDLDLHPLPMLTSEELEMLNRARATHYYPKAEDETQGFGDDVDFDESAPANVFDDFSPYYAYLREHFANRLEKPITYPCWVPPVQGPFTLKPSHKSAVDGAARARNKRSQVLEQRERAQPELYEEPQTPAARHYKRSDSFFNARKHTRKEMEQKYPANQKLLRDTVQKAKDLLRPDKTNAVACKTLAQHFLDLTRRPAQASDPDWKWVLNSYSWLGMMDDWWHVRRLFQALAVYVNDEGFTLHLNGFQVLLAQLLGAIYGGSTDPTPFNMCYEFVLRLMWRRLVEHKRMKESQYVNAFNQITSEKWIIVHNIFNELVLFARGTAINAIVIRYPKQLLSTKKLTGGRDDNRIARWYAYCQRMDPRCANRDCQKLLPPLSEVSNLRVIRQVLSVGAKDSRVGMYSVRRFISTNRSYVYPCFFDLFVTREPMPTLVILMYLHAHLYHPVGRGCKPARGKYDNYLV